MELARDRGLKVTALASAHDELFLYSRAADHFLPRDAALSPLMATAATNDTKDLPRSSARERDDSGGELQATFSGQGSGRPVLEGVLGLHLGFAGVPGALLRLTFGGHTVVAEGGSQSLLGLALGRRKGREDGRAGVR